MQHLGGQSSTHIRTVCTLALALHQIEVRLAAFVLRTPVASLLRPLELSAQTASPSRHALHQSVQQFVHARFNASCLHQPKGFLDQLMTVSRLLLPKHHSSCTVPTNVAADCPALARANATPKLPGCTKTKAYAPTRRCSLTRPCRVHRCCAAEVPTYK